MKAACFVKQNLQLKNYGITAYVFIMIVVKLLTFLMFLYTNVVTFYSKPFKISK